MGTHQLAPKELMELLEKFTDQELRYIELRHRLAMQDEFPDLVDYLRYIAAIRENDNATVNTICSKVRRRN